MIDFIAGCAIGAFITWAVRKGFEIRRGARFKSGGFVEPSVTGVVRPWGKPYDDGKRTLTFWSPSGEEQTIEVETGVPVHPRDSGIVDHAVGCSYRGDKLVAVSIVRGGGSGKATECSDGRTFFLGGGSGGGASPILGNNSGPPPPKK